MTDKTNDDDSGIYSLQDERDGSVCFPVVACFVAGLLLVSLLV